MKLYITQFTLPHIEDRWTYPYNILAPKQLRCIDFEPVTIFYGSNGSGKSTVLNIIARKLKMKMRDSGNDALAFQPFIDLCHYQKTACFREYGDIPEASIFIRSEDVMHEIVKLRQKNERIKEFVKDKYPHLYERYFNNPTGKKEYLWSDDSWIEEAVSDFCEGRSNGELAFGYFRDMISPDSLIFLDEPENSLSPKYQHDLANMLTDYYRFFNCQFIIATHSPFLLAIPGAKIYDLDAMPTDVKRWTELENIKLYAELFKDVK
ncbi:MAG: AAA family ATPase [Muribaculum sp.]|nr:AAA family ATPase [Muribaculum sp.]